MRIRFRRGTAASAASTNPILADGEPGYTTDTHVLKVGDGVTAWNSLEGTSGGDSGGGGSAPVEFLKIFAQSQPFDGDKAVPSGLNPLNTHLPDGAVVTSDPAFDYGLDAYMADMGILVTTNGWFEMWVTGAYTPASGNFDNSNAHVRLTVYGMSSPGDAGDGSRYIYVPGTQYSTDAAVSAVGRFDGYLRTYVNAGDEDTTWYLDTEDPTHQHNVCFGVVSYTPNGSLLSITDLDIRGLWTPV